MTKLSHEEIHQKLEELNGWEHSDIWLTKLFKFENFVQAVEFVNKLVPIAEKLNHHPDVTIQNYNEVRIGITTHDEGGITEMDFQLAKEFDKIS